jgi:hypothetical protein
MSSIIRKYRAALGKDLPAGLVVFLVALPLCLGIALASGAPALSGIITGIIGGIIVGCLSGSALSVSGPAAGLTVIVLNGITDLGSFQAFLVAVVLAGVFQLVLGFLNAGIIGLYFPSSVIRGMLAAIGLTLILKQIPHFLGFDQDFFGEMEFFQPDGQNTFSELLNAFDHIQYGALLAGVLSLFLIIFWDNILVRKFQALRLVPSALVAVLLSVGLSFYFMNYVPALAISKEHLVNLPVITSSGHLWQQIASPDFSQLLNPKIYMVAITIAIVASLETLLSIEAVDKLDPHKRITPPNRELKAQGMGNIISGLLGGLPMTAVIVRSSANLNAGGQTRVSAFVHGLLLLFSFLFLASFLNLIPLSALACAICSNPLERRTRRRASSKIEAKTRWYSSGVRSFIWATSSSPIMAVSGVRSSWEALETKVVCISKAVSRRSSMLLNVKARCETSSIPSALLKRKCRSEALNFSTSETMLVIGRSAALEKSQPATSTTTIEAQKPIIKIFFRCCSFRRLNQSISEAITIKLPWLSG